MYKDLVWLYDILMDRTKDRRTLRMLVVVDEYTRECSGEDEGRALKRRDILQALVGSGAC